MNRKSDRQVAAEVWSGRWGNGGERIQRLTAAGYNYAAIQALVNAGVGKPGIEKPGVRALANEQALRDLLDRINVSGLNDKVAGVDHLGNPFLACLTGPYAEGIGVLVGNPWDREVDYGGSIACQECGAEDLATVERLVFPLTVLVSLSPTPPRPWTQEEKIAFRKDWDARHAASRQGGGR